MTPKERNAMARKMGYRDYPTYLQAKKDEKYRGPRKKGSPGQKPESSNILKDAFSWHPKNTLEFVKKKMNSVWEKE